MQSIAQPTAKNPFRAVKIVACAAMVWGGASAVVAQPMERPNVQPGNWEISFTMEMPGMPAMAMRPTVATQCIKAEDWKDGDTMAKRMQGNSDRKCKITDIKSTANRMTWNMACDSGTTGSGEYLFAGTSYTGTVKMNIAGHGDHEAKTMTQHFKAKRLGPCN